MTLAVALLTMLLLVGLVVNFQLRSQLFNARKDAVLDDAAVRFSQAQSVLDQSTASTIDQVQEVVRQQLASTMDSAAGAGAISVFLLRSSEASPTFVINEFGSRELQEAISDDLRAAVDGGSNVWQSTAIPVSGGHNPGIAVGSLIQIPQAGAYQMFILYSLESEQQTILLVMRIIGVAALPLVFLVTLGTFLLIYRMLRPARSTAIAAMRLAAGDLESRVDVSGRDEMAQLGKAFNDMARSLQNQISEYDQLSQLQQRFVSDVSHELRTPLTTIGIAGEMIYSDRDSLSPVTKRSTELLYAEVGRMEEMLADLLEISRYDAQSEQLEWEMTDIYTLVEKTVEAERDLAERLGIEVIVGKRPKQPTAEVDGKRIERVIRNLLVNAYEYSEGSPVRITVGASPNAVAVSVKDQGVGMSEETISHVFDRFFRADPARARTTGGTGLGLAIAYEDVTAHGGRISAQGRLGEGSTFLVTLPRRFGMPLVDYPLGGGQ